jgi:hypothetical protein
VVRLDCGDLASFDALPPKGGTPNRGGVANFFNAVGCNPIGSIY